MSRLRIDRPAGVSAAAAAKNPVDVGDMLQHFHGEHHVEGFARFGKRLDGGGAIVDIKAAGFGVAPRGGDIFLPRDRFR